MLVFIRHFRPTFCSLSLVRLLYAKIGRKSLLGPERVKKKESKIERKRVLSVE